MVKRWARWQTTSLHGKFSVIMSKGTNCFEILLAKELPREVPPVVFASGDDLFLRRQSTGRILELLQIDSQETKVYDGEDCQWRDVHDELATVSLFDPGQRRVVVVKQGDKFVKEARSSLEKWCAAPVASSLLLVEVNTFLATTNLYKAVVLHGWAIDCAAPKSKQWGSPVDTKAVEKWVQQWAAQTHRLILTQSQSAMVVDMVGSDFGLLDRELAKAALYCEDNGKISDVSLKQAVGSWRTQTVWEVLEAVLEGKTGLALEQLHKLFQAGESPMGIAPQMSWSLRRFGLATHLIAQAERGHRPMPIRNALAKAGFRQTELQKAESQLRRIGRQRGQVLLEWLLELDLKLKSSHSNEQRGAMAIEEFVVRLSGPVQ